MFLILMFGCNVTKNFESKEYLLIKNKIQISDRSIPAEDIEPYIQQQPNKKSLGLFRTNIAIYNMGSKGNDSKFKTWLRKNVGTEPVILDTSSVTASLKQMNLYLGNKGFFQSVSTDSIIYKKKKATVIYRIRALKPYKIKKLLYAIPDTQVAAFVYMDTSKCLIRRGNNFDSYILDDERTRVTNNLQNHGFFRFSTAFIKYSIEIGRAHV